ncbi:MAG: histidine phosphatase family protein [Candidatus Thorarchaeota archaeon]|nr:MAG: histidine phosphatase family protein [Candidatus Thorarchaeota archaeon]
MDISEEKWQRQEWLSEARQLISWANSQPLTYPIMLAVRHSHRETVRTLDEMVDRRITDIGREMGREFGRRLPVDRRVVIRHSRIGRCRETAENLEDGIREMGGKVRQLEELGILVGPRVQDAEIWSNVGVDGIEVAKFVNDYADGRYHENRIERFESYRKRVIEGTIGTLIAAQPGDMYIYVTHDTFLLMAKRAYLSHAVADADRPPYLGGWGLSRESEVLRLFERGVTKEIEI